MSETHPRIREALENLKAITSRAKQRVIAGESSGIESLSELNNALEKLCNAIGEFADPEV